MKKIFAISLAASIALTMLAGCYENKSQTVKNDNTSVTEDELIIPRNMIMQKKFCKYIVLNEIKSSLCK